LQTTGANYAGILGCDSSDVRPDHCYHMCFQGVNFSVEIMSSIQICKRSSPGLHKGW
jgi:hypothetical protein